MLGAQCWMEARGLDFAEATPAQLIGAIQEVRLRNAQMEMAKALMRIAHGFGLMK